MARSFPPVTAIVLALALGAASAASAASPAQMRGNFDDADADHDGHVTLQEFQAHMTRRLKAADGPMAQRFNQLSPDQQADRLKERFEKLDSGHKGYLDRQDWSAS